MTKLTAMKLLLDNLPPALQPQRAILARCFEAFNQVRHVRAVYLFGSHARRDAHPDSDVDLCVVADGAERQLDTARDFRQELWEIWPRPALTLIPISPQRLQEKKEIGDHFFHTVLTEGVLLATED
jgi:predicted nucleotidyltransferase